MGEQMPNLMNESFTLPCGQVVKNRVCKAAMTERIAKGNNIAHQGHVNLYDRWADGDMGILLTGNVQIDRRNLEGPANVVIDQNNYKEQYDALKAWSAAGTKDNTQLWMQISHAGRQTPGEINSSPLAPSNIGLKIPGKNYGTPTPMTEEDILDVIDRFVFTAKLLEKQVLLVFNFIQLMDIFYQNFYHLISIIELMPGAAVLKIGLGFI